MLVILVSWRALAMAVPTLAYLAPVFKKIKNKKNLRALIFWGVVGQVFKRSKDGPGCSS